jgi:hypothetical protein
MFLRRCAWFHSDSPCRTKKTRLRCGGLAFSVAAASMLERGTGKRRLGIFLIGYSVIILYNQPKLPAMRYGKSAGRLELDESVRRKPSQSLKKAAPGAPFGWTTEGTPYVGTQYCLKGSPNLRSGLAFASLSTRNGGEQYFWKDLNTLSKKVALSALETHGSVEQLRAGESDAPCGELLEPAQLKAAKVVFARLVGEDTLRQFESAGDAEPVKVEAAAAVVQTQETPGKQPVGSAPDEESKRIGQKRKARMQV